MGAPSGPKAHLTRSGQEPSGSRFLLFSHGEDRYADFLNCSNRSASRTGRSTGLGDRVTVLSMEQSDTIASSGFMIAEAGRRFLRVSVSVTRPMVSIPRLDRIKAWLNGNCKRM